MLTELYILNIVCWEFQKGIKKKIKIAYILSSRDSHSGLFCFPEVFTDYILCSMFIYERLNII